MPNSQGTVGGYLGGFLSAEQRCFGPLIDSLNGSRLTNKALMAVAARFSPSGGSASPRAGGWA